MKTRHHLLALILTTILVVIFSAIHPLVARADDVTPPADPTQPADIQATDVATTDEPPADPAPTSIPDVLNQAPDGTDIVVLGSDGATVPLASQEAADILSDSDPMWCPGEFGTPGATLPGDAACVKANTVALLIPKLATKTGSGTIYFKPNYITSDATFDQVADPTNLGNLTDLTIQGGWDGATTVTPSDGTRFTVPLTVKWNSDVTLNDLLFDGAESSTASLTVNTLGNIVLNDVVVRSNDKGKGARLNNSSSVDGASVTVNNSKFHNNYDTGLHVISSGDVVLNDVIARDNVNGKGVKIDNDTSALASTVFVYGDSLFSHNGGTGLHIDSAGDVNLEDVIANDNGNGGIIVDTFGDITLTDVTARNNNSGSGVELDNAVVETSLAITEPPPAFAVGSVVVDGGDFSRNSHNGLDIHSSGDVTVDGATITQNHWDGLRVDTAGNILVQNVSANDNRGDGAYLYNPYGLGTISIEDSTFGYYDSVLDADHGNRYWGLEAISSGDISLRHVTATHNLQGGARLENGGGAIFCIGGCGGIASVGNTTVESSTFNGNGGAAYREDDGPDYALPGLLISSFGTVSLTDVIARDNELSGVNIPFSGEVLISGVNDFSSNWGFFQDSYSFGGLPDFVYPYETLPGGLLIGYQFDMSSFSTPGVIAPQFVSIDGVTANDNVGGSGLYIYAVNYYPSGYGVADGTPTDVITSGNWLEISNSTFNHNDLGGIYQEFPMLGGPATVEDLGPYGGVSLSNVTASDNGAVGALLWTFTGPLSISGSHFDDNFAAGGSNPLPLPANGVGSVLLAYGGLDIQSSTFDGNDQLGLFASTFDGVTITDSHFNGNGAGGAYITTAADIVVNNSTFNENGWGSGNVPEFLSGSTGIAYRLLDATDPTINCSQFIHNKGYGIASYTDGPDVLFTNGDTFSANTIANVYQDGDYATWTDDPGYQCEPSPDNDVHHNTPQLTILPWNTVHVQGGEGTDLQCTQYAGTTLILPNGDQVRLPCPNGDRGTLSALATDKLPGALDEQFGFVSALNIQVDPALTGTMTVAFTIPADQQDKTFTIMQWDGTQWVEVGGVARDGMFVVDTTLTGNFILVSK